MLYELKVKLGDSDSIGRMKQFVHDCFSNLCK